MIEVRIFTVVVAVPEAPSVVVLTEKGSFPENLAPSGFADTYEDIASSDHLSSLGHHAASLSETSETADALPKKEMDEEPHLLPIWIGHSEAEAIMHLLEGRPHVRPLTHDLLASTVGALGSKVERVVIDRVVKSVFFASICLNRNGRIIRIDARPSDSIALALRTKSSIFVDKDVMNAAARQFRIKVSDGGELLYGSDDEMARFRSFIESVSPEDFSL